VVVERTARHARVLDQLLGAGLGVALLGEQLARGPQERLAGLVGPRLLES
jgi:hypothetical protein